MPVNARYFLQILIFSPKSLQQLLSTWRLEKKSVLPFASHSQAAYTTQRLADNRRAQITIGLHAESKKWNENKCFDWWKIGNNFSLSFSFIAKAKGLIYPTNIETWLVIQIKMSQEPSLHQEVTIKMEPNDVDKLQEDMQVWPHCLISVKILHSQPLWSCLLIFLTPNII